MRCPVLVGRGDVMAALGAALARALTGRGQVIALAGEPGIGKTRLVAEVTRVGHARGIVTLSGRASAEAEVSALRPLSEALLVGTRDLPRPANPDLLPFLPVLGLLLPHWRPAGWAATAESPIVVAEAVLRLLRHLAGERALLLVLEDLHWADEATLAVVEFLADHCHEIPVVVSLTTREEQGHGPRLLAVLERASAPVHRLPRLSPDDVERMISACTGDEPGRHTAIARAAEGLPLVIEDLLAAGGSGPPRRFADSVRDRAAALTPGRLRAVQAAALLGEDVDWDVVRSAVGPDGVGPDGVGLPGVGPDADGALEAAVALGLLVAEAGGVRFRHALTRAVILADVPAVRRTELAGAAGAALLRVRPAGLTRDVRAAALLTEAGQPGRALDVLREAGERATAAGEIADAEAALRAGFELAQAHDQGSASALGCALAEVLVQAGKPAEVVALGSRLLSLVEGRDGVPEARLHVVLARAQIGRGAWSDAQAHLRQARVAGDRDARAVAEVAVLETECALGEDRAGQRAAVEHLAMRGVALARAAGAVDLEAEALEQAGRVARMRDLDAAAASLRAALALAGAHGLDYRRLQVLNELGTVEMLRDARPERLARAREEALRCGAFGLGTSAGLNLASAYAMTGRITECVALIREVGDAAGRLDQMPILAGCELIEGIAHAFTGDQERAERHLGRAERLAPGDGDLRAGAWGIGRGVGALVVEDRDGARRALARAAREAPERHARILDAALGPALLLAALAGEGSSGHVNSLAASQVRGARWHDLWLGAASAVALAREGDVEAAAAGLEAALAAGDRYPLFAALVRRLVAEAAIQTAFTDPLPLLRDAEAAFDELGLPRPAAAVRGLLRSLGAAAPRRRRGDAPTDRDLARSGVTAREAEVLGLLADRLTNKAIAQRLYLSPKTVEKHIAALARKLGARDRVELAEVARTRRR